MEPVDRPPDPVQAGRPAQPPDLQREEPGAAVPAAPGSTPYEITLADLASRSVVRRIPRLPFWLVSVLVTLPLYALEVNRPSLVAYGGSFGVIVLGTLSTVVLFAIQALLFRRG